MMMRDCIARWIPVVALGGLGVAVLAGEGLGAAPQGAVGGVSGLCAGSIQDRGNPGQCLRASSVPTPGRLYPLGLEFSVDPAGNTSAMGTVESRGGGFVFPDGSVQLTAASVGGAGRIPIRQADMPLTIATPGSYVVIEPLTGQSGFDGIVIASDDVTLDLNGFTLAGGAGTLDGIRITSGLRRGTLVQNGTLRGWGDDGVDAAGGVAVEHAITLRDLTLLGNGANGIRGGSVVHVLGCRSDGNGAIGIAVGGQCVVEDNEVRQNGSHGIQVENSCSVRDNYVWLHSSGAGIRVSGGDTLVRDNLVGQCLTGVNIATGLPCLVVKNTANSCTTAYDAPSGVGAVTNDPSSAAPWGNLVLP